MKPIVGNRRQLVGHINLARLFTISVIVSFALSISLFCLIGHDGMAGLSDVSWQAVSDVSWRAVALLPLVLIIVIPGPVSLLKKRVLNRALTSPMGRTELVTSLDVVSLSSIRSEIMPQVSIIGDAAIACQSTSDGRMVTYDELDRCWYEVKEDGSVTDRLVLPSLVRKD